MKKVTVVTMAVLFVVSFLIGATTSWAGLVNKIQIIPLDEFSTGVAGFDIGWVDSGMYYLAERGPTAGTKGRVEIINAIEDESEGFIGGFVGTTSSAARGGLNSGPNGIVVIPATPWKRELWAGDGDSTVKVVDLASKTIVHTISTGGAHRADELAYDPIDHIIMIANDLEIKPFVTFISTMPGHAVLGTIAYDGSCSSKTGPCAPGTGPNANPSLKDGGGGLEQPVFHGKYFYFSVPQTTDFMVDGEIDVIDPVKMQIVKRFPATGCGGPTGLTHGPGHDLLPGCAAQTIIMDDRDGTILQTIPEVNGPDEVWYNPGDNRYYLAASSCNTAFCTGPVLGVIDALGRSWIENVPTPSTDGPPHSVAVNPLNNHIFVPIAGDKGIAVFEPADENNEFDLDRICKDRDRGEDRDHKERDRR